LKKTSGNGLFDRQLWAALDPGDHDSALMLLWKIAARSRHIRKAGIPVHEIDRGTKPYLSDLLEPIYERHFQLKPGRTRRDDDDHYAVGGPFTRFVAAVGLEMSPLHLEVSAHTVDKALRKRPLVKS
jgi:hypothetical protein